MTSETLIEAQNSIANELNWINGISTEEQYEQALICIESMMGNESIQPFLIELVGKRIAQYEMLLSEMEILNTNESGNGLAALITLMGHRKLKNLALVDVLGSKSLVSQIMNGKRALTIPHIYALAKYFNVKPSVFL